MRAKEGKNTSTETPFVNCWTQHELKYLTQVITPDLQSNQQQQKRKEIQTPQPQSSYEASEAWRE